MLQEALNYLLYLKEESLKDPENIAKKLEYSLDEYQVEDGFGTECQCDPRGDFRNGDYSIWNVEGFDSNKDQNERNVFVIDRIINIIEEDEYFLDFIIEMKKDEENLQDSIKFLSLLREKSAKENENEVANYLDVVLEQYHMDDGFGTEGESDPRGDFRHKTYSMRDVKGCGKSKSQHKRNSLVIDRMIEILRENKCFVDFIVEVKEEIPFTN